MKIKIQLLVGIMISAGSLMAQSIPSQGSSNATSDFWSRSGNLQTTGANIFGTRWNSPIYTISGGISPANLRMKVNAIFSSGIQYPINGFGWNQGVNTTGYVLIGQENNSITDNKPLYNQKGAFSLLHLNGIGSAYQEYGYRPWMKTGITFTGNQDLSYIGLRKLSTNPSQEDITETAFLWSDNSQSSYGPDKLVFRFSGYGGSDGNAVSSNRLSTTDLDALHVAQFTGTGLMGLGNTFGTNATGMAAANYVDPKSLLHMSYDWRAGAANLAYGFAQITYRRDGTNMIGTGETENDGLRFGIDNTIVGSGAQQHLDGYLRWQEASSFIVQTEDNNSPNITQNERLRITSIGALALNWGSAYMGNTLPPMITRISMSHNGASALTKPLSLLHLGYDLGASFGTLHVQHGWRSWMDLGMLISNNTDNVWMGLKPRSGSVSSSNDQMDAVISWGDDGSGSSGSSGPDMMRFIFTADPLFATADSSAAKSNEGLEIMRLYPHKDTVFNSTPTATYGRVGIGDFTSQGVNQQPTHKLDVVGNGRFRYLPDSIYMTDTTVTKYVMVDQAGVLRWSEGAPSGLGAVCGDTINGKLKDNTHIDLNNFNFYYTNNDSLGQNHVGMGYDCGDTLPAKLSVEQRHPFTVPSSTIGISGINLDTANVSGLIFTGVEGKALGVQNLPKTINRGGFFTAQNAPDTRGFQVDMPPSANNTQIAIGGEFKVYTKAHNNYGILAQANGNGANTYNRAVYGSSMNSNLQNIGGVFIGNSSGTSTGRSVGLQASANFSSISNVAGMFRVAQNLVASNIAVAAVAGSQYPSILPTGSTVAVYGNSTPFINGNGTNNGFAGFFDGNVYINGPANGVGFALTSDQQFKTNIDTLSTIMADSILKQLKPKTFFFDTTNAYGMNFSSQKQYGLIAQDVEPILPELISNQHKPAMVDSTGNIVIQAVDYKSLNYNAFISILIKGHQEQQAKIDSLLANNAPTSAQIDSLQAQIDSLVAKNGQQDAVINDLNNRLTQLENCLGNLLPLLCQLNQSMIQTNNEDAQQQLRSLIRVDLNDNENIVLDQNVPNPFAESTIIRYSIPASVQKAQIHFYNLSGRLMKVVDITERGAGQLNVFGQDLSSGVYTYTLVADGRIIDTKKMVKEGY